MTTALGTGLRHTINGSVPFDVRSIKMVATIGAFESDCSSYHKNVLYLCYRFGVKDTHFKLLKEYPFGEK
jgi:hypothetical protein